jgi:DNA-binding HxlR family transcriptional regulator
MIFIALAEPTLIRYSFHSMKKTPPPLLPGSKVRGSQSGRPIMVALDLLGRRMSMAIIWELRNERLSFRGLQSAIDTNPGLLNTRLAELRAAHIIDHDGTGYGVTEIGRQLIDVMLPLVDWSHNWADVCDSAALES